MYILPRTLSHPHKQPHIRTEHMQSDLNLKCNFKTFSFVFLFVLVFFCRFSRVCVYVVWNFKTKRCNKELFGAQKYNITYKTPYAFYNTGPGPVYLLDYMPGTSRISIHSIIHQVHQKTYKLSLDLLAYVAFQHGFHG